MKRDKLEAGIERWWDVGLINPALVSSIFPDNFSLNLKISALTHCWSVNWNFLQSSRSVAFIVTSSSHNNNHSSHQYYYFIHNWANSDYSYEQQSWCGQCRQWMFPAALCPWWQSTQNRNFSTQDNWNNNITGGRHQSSPFFLANELFRFIYEDVRTSCSPPQVHYLLIQVLRAGESDEAKWVYLLRYNPLFDQRAESSVWSFCQGVRKI